MGKGSRREEKLASGDRRGGTNISNSVTQEVEAGRG